MKEKNKVGRPRVECGLVLQQISQNYDNNTQNYNSVRCFARVQNLVAHPREQDAEMNT